MPNLSRKNMPQVKTQDLGKALDMVADKVRVTKETIPASKLKKSQKELYKDKVKGIANRFNSPKDMKPLIISKDNHIVDGHHRWGAAIYKWGEDVKIPVHRINLTIDNAIKLYKHIADTINEVMSIAARKKLARKSKSKLKRGVKKRIKKMKKKRSNSDLLKAAERKAKTILMQKMMKKSPADMSMNDKIKFSEKLAKSPGKIQKVAKKILPKLKQAEAERVKKMRARNTQKNEAITIPIEIGDTVLGGKFKNKRIVVKSIDKNEKGDITINGKPLLKFRLVNEANAVSGGKVHKFITGKNLTFKGKKYPNLYFEVLRIDNKSKLVTLKILSPKELFGKELDVPFKTIRRGPFLKTDTSGLGESTINEIGGVRFDLVGYDSNNKPVLKKIARSADSFMKDVAKWGSEKLFKSGKGVDYVKIYYDKTHLATVKDGGRKIVKEKGWGKLPINEIPMGDLQKIDQFADKKLNPVDVVLTDKHFFDRLNDPRNGKEISQAELIGFFKRLSKKRKEFVEFLNQYNSLVAVDDRTNINIPFMKQSNKAIAKTIMRKKDFKSSDKRLDI
jgi:hypothetical protein